MDDRTMIDIDFNNDVGDHTGTLSCSAGLTTINK